MVILLWMNINIAQIVLSLYAVIYGLDRMAEILCLLNSANSDKRKICILIHLYFRSKSKIVFGNFDNQLIEWVYHVNVSAWQEVMGGITHWGQCQMGAFFHTTFLNVYS